MVIEGPDRETEVLAADTQYCVGERYRLVRVWSGPIPRGKIVCRTRIRQNDLVDDLCQPPAAGDTAKVSHHESLSFDRCRIRAVDGAALRRWPGNAMKSIRMGLIVGIDGSIERPSID